ncbi:MAG: hypothetical protein JKY99_02950 [Rhizobiales bacterium]|nr:hypothetical protein [Hyphomicrobiales bacterium]
MTSILGNRVILRFSLAVLMSLPLIFGSTSLPLYSGIQAQAHQTGSRALSRDPRGPGFIPACNNARVLKRIQRKFNWAERKTWSKIRHAPARQLSHIQRVRQTRATGRTKSRIDHRHCRAHGVLSNGYKHTIYYMIEERMGFASLSWQVSYCMRGHDSWHVYGASCKSVR